MLPHRGIDPLYTCSLLTQPEAQGAFQPPPTPELTCTTVAVHTISTQLPKPTRDVCRVHLSPSGTTSAGIPPIHGGYLPAHDIAFDLGVSMFLFYRFQHYDCLDPGVVICGRADLVSSFFGRWCQISSDLAEKSRQRFSFCADNNKNAEDRDGC